MSPSTKMVLACGPLMSLPFAARQQRSKLDISEVSRIGLMGIQTSELTNCHKYSDLRHSGRSKQGKEKNHHRLYMWLVASGAFYPLQPDLQGALPGLQNVALPVRSRKSGCYDTTNHISQAEMCQNFKQMWQCKQEAPLGACQEAQTMQQHPHMVRSHAEPAQQ